MFFIFSRNNEFSLIFLVIFSSSIHLILITYFVISSLIGKKIQWKNQSRKINISKNKIDLYFYTLTIIGFILSIFLYKLSISIYTMSTNVDDYTINELMDIIGIDTLTEENVKSACQYYIQQMKGSNNQEMIIFFQNIKTKLLGEIDIDNENEDEDEDQGEDDTNLISLSFEKDFLRQPDNQVEIVNSDHSTMGRKHSGIPESFAVDVSRDKLNPTLQNTVSRNIVIDSAYRQATSEVTDLTTDFTLDLSEHLVNVLSIRLSSIQIPFSWFNINSQRNFFYIYNRYNSNETYHLIQIEKGNYNTIDDIFLAINQSFLKAGFKKTNGAENFIYLKNGMVFIDLLNTTINGNMLNVYDEESRDENNVSGIFFYPLHDSEIIQYCNNKILRGRYDYENTLGWLFILEKK